MASIKLTSSEVSAEMSALAMADQMTKHVSHPPFIR